MILLSRGSESKIGSSFMSTNESKISLEYELNGLFTIFLLLKPSRLKLNGVTIQNNINPHSHLIKNLI